jgi:putative hemolysin
LRVSGSAFSRQGREGDARTEPPILSEFLTILALILVNGTLAGAEIAIIAVRRTRLSELVESGVRAALAVKTLRDDPERFLATVQIGITVVGSTAAALGGATFVTALEPALRRIPDIAPYAPEIAFAVVVGAISFLTVVLGELVPKSLALRASERYALLTARPLLWMSHLTRPFVWVLAASSNLVLRLFGARATFVEPHMSQEEVQQVVETATSAGAVDPEAGVIASRALSLADLSAAKVMVPRTLVVAVPREATAEQLRQIILERGHTRMPVYEKTIDDVVGYINVKDLFGLLWERRLIVLDDILRPAFFAPETMRVLSLLHEMRTRRVQLAIVVDEQGAMSGIVTLEDMFEELVGEIFSEYEHPVPERIRQEGPDTFVVQGNLPVRDANRELGLDLPEEGPWSSIAGLVIELAGRMPHKGESFQLKDGTILTIVEASERQVRLVRLRKSGEPGTPRA